MYIFLNSGVFLISSNGLQQQMREKKRKTDDKWVGRTFQKRVKKGKHK